MIGRFLNRFNIGGKLNIGFGILVALTLLVVGLSYLASAGATTKINTTTDLSAPTALASARAQANLLTMLGDVRGYLALGDEEYRTGYHEAKAAFEADLAELEALKQQRDPFGPPSTNPEFDRRLEDLKTTFEQWSTLPDRLFELRDDQLQREPALRLLLEDGNPLIATILVNISRMIATHQERLELTKEDVALLNEMNSFQTSFFAMVAGLRGYITTGRDNFKFEYTSNAAINDKAWEKLLADEDRLDINQQARLGQIAETRAKFSELPPQMFEAVEGEHAREDLYLFRTEAVPLAETMLQLLNEMTVDQQKLLQSDLSAGRSQLAAAQWQTLAGGVVAVLLALGLAFVFRENIAGPVQRLTHVAEQIGTGDLTRRAAVESSDEIGTLAQTFNQMTGRLGQTLDDLEQRRHELQVAAETLQGQNEYLSALHETSLGLLNRLDLNELLEALVVRAGHLLDAPYGYIYLVEPALDALELKVVVGISERQIGDRMQPGEGLAGKVWHSRQPVIVDDYDSWPGRSPEISYGLIRALAGMPLIRRTTSDAQVVGVIGLGYAAGSNQTFGEDEIQLLTRFAELASIALDNARLFETTQQANRDLAQTLEELQATQSQLIQSEKMAALGQLIAGIAHEINTPLGAINASIGNISHALEDSLRQLPQLLQQLSPEQQGEFFALVDTALQNKTLLTSREERKLRRALRNDLEDQDVAEADTLADMLVEMGLHDGIEPYLPLLRADNAIAILQSAYNLVSQQRNSLNIKTAVERASKIVFALKSYARQDHRGDKVEANIPESLDTVLTLYHNQLKQGVEVIKQYDDVPSIHCYADELNQVWTNLVHNALQAMEYRGVLEIEVKRLEIGDWRLGDEETGSPNLPISPSPHYLAVSITDSGPGIPDEIKERIFDPFFTTKPAGEGSGLGLDIVRKIVEKHEGRIEVESEPGRTTFRVLLPIETS